MQWIGREDWIYERRFEIEDLSAHHAVRLACEGLDTLATLSLNGAELGRTDNMFRAWTFDVREALRVGRSIPGPAASVCVRCAWTATPTRGAKAFSL